MAGGGQGGEQREEGALTKLRSGLQNVAAQGVHGETQQPQPQQPGSKMQSLSGPSGVTNIHC